MVAPQWSEPLQQPQVASEQQWRSVVGVEAAVQPSQAELQRITELLRRWSNGTRRAVNGPRQALPGEIQQLQGLVKEMQQLQVVPCLRNARDGMAEGMGRYTAALLSHLQGNASDDEIARRIRVAQSTIETNVVGMLVCRSDIVVVAAAAVKVTPGV
jgi:uncharacterized protein YcbK (DUF882 family)